MVVGQQNANGIKSSLHDRSSSFSKITRYCFEQEMIGKQSRRGHVNPLRCPRPAPSPLPILRLVPSRAPALPPTPQSPSPPLHSRQPAARLFRHSALLLYPHFC